MQLKEYSSNLTLIKLGQGLSKLRQFKDIPVGQIDMELKMLDNSKRGDKLLRVIRKIIDGYNLKFNKPIISDVEFIELINMFTEDNISIIATVILTISCCEQTKEYV